MQIIDLNAFDLIRTATFENEFKLDKFTYAEVMSILGDGLPSTSKPRAFVPLPADPHHSFRVIVFFRDSGAAAEFSTLVRQAKPSLITDASTSGINDLNKLLLFYGFDAIGVEDMVEDPEVTLMQCVMLYLREVKRATPRVIRNFASFTRHFNRITRDEEGTKEAMLYFASQQELANGRKYYEVENGGVGLEMFSKRWD